MSRQSQTKHVYVQTAPDRPMSRLSCVQKYLRVLRAFKTPYVQTFVHSKSYMTRLWCVPNQNSCAQNLNICAFMSRLSCVQKHLCPAIRLADGGASHPVIKIWFVLPLQQWSIILGVKLSIIKKNVGCSFSCVNCFVTQVSWGFLGRKLSLWWAL